MASSYPEAINGGFSCPNRDGTLGRVGVTAFQGVALRFGFIRLIGEVVSD